MCDVKEIREKNHCENFWGWEAHEKRHYHWSPRVWPFTAEWFFSVNFQLHYKHPIGFFILTSSHYQLLSTTLRHVLQEISKRRQQRRHLGMNFLQCLKVIAKSEFNREFTFCVCQKRSSRTDHSTTVTCLLRAAESLKWKSASIF